MTNELYNYIYDAMCWMLEYMDDISDKINPYVEDKGIAQYDKLDKAAGRFQKWYEENCDYQSKVYIIMWSGRDSDSEVWDDYPCFDYGFYTDFDSAHKKVIELNEQHPGEYDSDADATETYWVKTLNKKD